MKTKTEQMKRSEKFDIDYTEELENSRDGIIDVGEWINRAIRDMEELEKEVNKFRSLVKLPNK